jgi:hypothetical protein
MASMAENGVRIRERQGYAKRMSSHIAYALVVYTLLLIFEVSPQMESKGMSIMPYFLLVLLVGLAIMPCRNLERRWQRLDSDSQSAQGSEFRRDVVVLWLCAIGLPTLLMLVIWIIP